MFLFFILAASSGYTLSLKALIIAWKNIGWYYVAKETAFYETKQL